jgi:hypothetical protein
LPVDDEINLNDPEGITQDDLDIMNRDADELEELAKGAERNAEKIKKATESLKLMDFATKNIIQSEVQGTPNDMSSIDMATRIELLEKQILEMGKHIKSNNEKHNDHEIKIDEHGDEINEAKLHRIQIERQIQSGIQKGYGQINKGFSFMRSPLGTTKSSALGMIGKSSVVGAIAVMVLEMAQQVYEQVLTQIKDMYKAGGVLDVRKDQLDSLRQVSSLQSVIDMEQGRVMFTSDTGEILRQGVPQATNTQGRVNGYKQYLQEYQR